MIYLICQGCGLKAVSEIARDSASPDMIKASRSCPCGFGQMREVTLKKFSETFVKYNTLERNKRHSSKEVRDAERMKKFQEENRERLREYQRKYRERKRAEKMLASKG